jgi:FkbM family methyltransferase
VAVEPQRHCADELRRRFGGSGAVVLESALGAAPGEAELFVTDYDTVSTLSREWSERVRAAGRFDLEWHGSETVPVTTLDALIAEHGCPVFCKIDVEGYEPQVLAGLSEPIRTVLFEFTPEFPEAASASIERLRELGLARFAFSSGESLELGPWMGAAEISAFVEAAPRDGRMFGDIYAAL